MFELGEEDKLKKIDTMENCSNIIRVRVDLSEIRVPFIKQAWVSVDRTVLRTVEDFRHRLHHKFKFPEDRKTSLYLQRCLLPDDETIFVLRDEDFIRVVYEDLPSLLDTQSSSFVDFASDSAKSLTRHHTDGNSDASVPAAKKFKTLSPVHAVPLLGGTYGAQTSLSDSRWLRNVPTEINNDIRLGKTELVRKKHKKHKKQSKVKKEYTSSENLLVSEERVNGSASEVHVNNVCDNDELACFILPVEDIQKQEDETTAPQKVTNSNKYTMKKRKYSSENSVHIVTRKNYTSGTFQNDTDCTDDGTSKLSSFVLCEEDIKNDDKIKSAREIKTPKECKMNEEGHSSEIIVQCGERVCCASDELENSVGIQKHGGKSDDETNLGDLYISQNEKCDHISSQIESKIDMDHSSSQEICENVLCPSQNDSPMQVEGDCTQSLGNNCPKKKRRRRRRRGPHNVAGSSGTISNDFNVLPSSQCSIKNSISDLIQVRNEHHDRKHIRFLDSPENSPLNEALDSKCSGDNTGKGISANTGQSSLESFKTRASPTYETDTFVENYTAGTSFNQEKLFVPSAQGDGTSNKNNGLTTECKLRVADAKSYFGFPPLTKFPSIGDVIAYKVLELTDSYCPEVSNYKEGVIVNIDSKTDTLQLKLLEEEVIVREGKFENVYSDEEPEYEVITKVFVHWSALIEPKLISSSEKS